MQERTDGTHCVCLAESALAPFMTTAECQLPGCAPKAVVAGLSAQPGTVREIPV